MKRDSTVWDELASLPVCRITSIPRPCGDSGPDTAQAQRAAALSAAWHAAAAGAPAGVIATGWMRSAEGSPVELLAAGHLLAGGPAGQEVTLALPAGARGHLLPPGTLPRLLAWLPCWQPVSGLADGLLTDSGQDPRPTAPGVALEDFLLPAWTGPFGWIVIAEPVSPAAVAEMADEAARAAHLAAITTDRHPERGPQARRLHLRHSELRRGLSAGMWQLHIAAGAAIPHDAARIAGLACGTPGLAGLPYLITPANGPPAGISQLLSTARAASRPAGDSTAGFPFTASTGLLAALARPPATEIPGVRLVLSPAFDTTPEHALSAAAGQPWHATGVIIGQVLDRSLMPAGPLTLPMESLNRHVFVSGATGAGKSQTVRGLLEAATAAGIPWLVIEPAKAEYRAMAARLAPSGTPVIRIRPGDPDGIPAGLNPLEPAPGPDGTRFPLQTHADLVRALFLASFRADEPFPQVLSAALTRVYEESGWDLALGEPVRAHGDPGYPGLAALHRAAEQVVTEIGYSQRVTDDVLGFIRIRLASLRHGTTGRFLDGCHQLHFGELLRRNVVLEIEDVGDDQDKAFLMGAVLIRLTEHLRITHRTACRTAAGLAHLTVVEEAHRLLRRPDPVASAAAQATEMFAALLAEIRAYGEGLIIAEQIPGRLIHDIIKNTAVKIVHRLPALDDREAVGATMNLTQAQSEYLVTLSPGEAAVHADGMDYPLLARMPDGTAREAASPAITASAGPVITQRSATCGTACLAEPCTLGQMRAAQRATVTDPRLTLWAELSVIAHLTGWDMPRPAPMFAASLGSMDDRLADCALSHAVDAAVAARIPAISTRVSPAALAVHVTAVMRQALSAGTRACDTEEPRYLAPPYRWALVRDALRAACRSPGAGPHPRSAEWERTYGQPVPGATSKAQFTAVSRWYLRDQRDSRAITTIVWGSRPHSAIEQAVGTRAGSGDWPAQLSEALGAFTRLRWPRNLLRGTPARTLETPGQPGTADE